MKQQKLNFKNFLRIAGFPGVIYNDFDKKFNNPLIKKCLQHKDKIINKWIIFYGPTGTGKTYAAAVAAYLIYKHHGFPANKAVFLPAYALVPDDEQYLLDIALYSKLVIIDDLFAERREITPMIENLIMDLYNNGAFLIATTNFGAQYSSIARLRQEYMRALDGRVVDRIFSRTIFIRGTQPIRPQDAEIV